MTEELGTGVWTTRKAQAQNSKKTGAKLRLFHLKLRN